MPILYQSNSQKQSLMICQDMIQACNILSMSIDELRDYIQEIAIQNPLISFESLPHISPFGSIVEFHGFRESTIDYTEALSDKYNLHSSESSLKETLCLQIPARTSFVMRKIMIYIIDLLDKDGYFREDEYIVAKHLGCNQDMLNSALREIQKMDPIGVGARSLKECLSIQLKQMFPEENLCLEIVENHFDKLIENKLMNMTKTLHCTRADICSALEIVKQLEPRPARQYSEDSARYIIPDITVAGQEDNFNITLNKDVSIDIKIDDDYELFICDDDETAKKYLAEKKLQASALQLFVQKRYTTLLLVCTEIFNAQKAFFHKGPEYLRPLKQKDISDALGCHESTVFRAVKGKYLSCPWGTYPLTYFFSNTIECEDGYDACNPKEMIRSIIDAENKLSPLSDQAIANRLVSQGIQISRRTVAKYRNEAGILPMSLRKQYT